MLRIEKDDPSTNAFQVRRCSNAACGLRFTTPINDPRAAACPLCASPTSVLGEDFGRFAIQQVEPPARGVALEVLLDNIRSAWNVGSMLRSADGAGVRHVHLCGVSATPDHPKVAKTALGAEKSTPWTFHHDGLAAARRLQERGLRLWALEGGPRAVSLFEALPGPVDGPIALVVGNELAGVDPGILALCERVVSLPMLGVKGSLNVAVAFGVAVYAIRFGAPPPG